MWRIPEPFLEAAQDDATRLAIRDLERAGVDIITDGEIRRESYSNRFALALDGIDLAHPGAASGRSGGVANHAGATCRRQNQMARAGRGA